ncbi:MAG TPA: site-2 protease family protein [Mycobacteriales bacterium]|nr:site-2 protease family protein [Mycobacteriales bacterium]
MGLGVLAFIVAIVFSIALHEVGHLATAKAFGMKATQYFIGFGPRIWSFRRGETEYGVKAIPAGGYVKIVGMTELEEVEPEDEARAFWRQPAPQRAVVLTAGSAMHFLLAAVLFAVALIAVGVRTGDSTTTVEIVSECVPADPEGGCGEDDPPSPAKAAGVRRDDRVVSFAGRPVEKWAEFTERVRATPAGPAELVVERDGSPRTLTVDVVRVRRPDLDDEKKIVTVGAVGLAPRSEVRRFGLGSGLAKTGVAMKESFVGTGKALVGLPASIPKLVRSSFGSEDRDPEGALSLIGAGSIAGEVVDEGMFAEFLTLIASINVFIGVFNLVPLLPLDGGHLGVLVFEQARSRIARALGRPDPGRVDLRKLLPAAYTFIVLLVALQVLVLYADVANPIANPFSG